jgi:hypothetical protein
VYQSTVRALLADLKRGLQERQPEPMAIPLFVGLRVPDDQALRDLQEDLVVAATGQFPVAGKSNQRPELGLPLSDGVRAEFTKLGAKCALVGSVSLRGEMTVVNAALVDLGNGEILATARAWQ